MTREQIRTETQLDDAQRGLLAWSAVVSGDEGLDRLKDHIVLVAASLRTALRLECSARELLTSWVSHCGSISEELRHETERWLAASVVSR